MRNPSIDQNPLDQASFYIESLKYGPGAGKVEVASVADIVGEFEILLRDAGYAGMTGRELYDAVYYGRSLAKTLGELRNPKGS